MGVGPREALPGHDPCLAAAAVGGGPWAAEGGKLNHWQPEGSKPYSSARRTHTSLERGS